jgi:hypothetical protein
MKVQHLIEQQLRHGRGILTESCNGLTDQQRVIVEGIYNDLEVLVEASLTPDQIQTVFGAVEKEVTAGGDNRTLAGLGVDAAKQVDQTIDNIGKWLQDTKPVQAFDQKFEDLKTKIAQKFPKVAAQVSKLGDWAKENPGKTAAIVGVLTTIAALGTGPVGAAIAGQILRGSAELLKGEKLSTAIGKGVKTAAYGFIAGKTFELIGDALSNGLTVVKDNMFPGAVKMSWSRFYDEVGGELGTRSASFSFKDLVGKPEDVGPIRDLANEAADAWKAGEYQLSKTLWRQANDAIEVLKSPDYVAAIAKTAETRQMIQQGIEAASMATDFLAAAAQGAVQAGGMQKAKKESVYRQTRPLSEGQVYMVFNKTAVLSEGPMDLLKKGADWVGKKAHNLTTKLTADKLNSAWVKAGSPTDSEELRQFLSGQGIADDIINKVYDEMKIAAAPAASGDQDPPAGQAAMSYKELKDLVPKLKSKEKQRLAAYLQKQLGTA